MKIYIVHTPTWESEFDSAWSTEEQAQDRADVLDPHPDKDGVRWGIITEHELDGDPHQEGSHIERRAI